MTGQSIQPLVASQNPEFMRNYQSGLSWTLEHQKGVYADNYLVSNLKNDVYNGCFNELTEHYRSHVGFYFGMIHGGVLSPLTRTLRPDAKTLITFTQLDSTWGYTTGRRAYFKELSPRERIPTDTRVIEGLCELVQNNRESFVTDHDQLLYWWTGDILGNLSGQLFPATQEDFHQWQRSSPHSCN
jgi:hypothetical protein